MSIRITTDVFCDKCGQWGHFRCSEKAEIASAKKAAREDGWSFLIVDGQEELHCPVCNKSEPRYFSTYGRSQAKKYRIQN